MIERKKDRFLGERNLSFLFVGPPGDCVVGSGLFENAMCVEVKRLIFDKIALRENPSFRDVSSVLANQCQSACKRDKNLPSAEKKTPTDVCFSVGVFEWDVLF